MCANCGYAGLHLHGQHFKLFNGEARNALERSGQWM